MSRPKMSPIPALALSASLFSVLSTAFLGTAFPSTAHADPPRPAVVTEVDDALIDAERGGRELLTLLDRSRRAQRVRQTQCVDRALSQINSFARSLNRERTRLLAAAQRGDRSEVAHRGRVARVLAAQLRERTLAGRACVYGEVRPGDGVTVLEVIVDRRVPRHRDLAAARDTSRPW